MILHTARAHLPQKRQTRVSVPDELVDPQLFGQRLPLAVPRSLRLRIHDNLIGPGAGEAFGGPFAGGVDAHLGAVVGQAAGVVERAMGPRVTAMQALELAVCAGSRATWRKVGGGVSRSRKGGEGPGHQNIEGAILKGEWEAMKPIALTDALKDPPPGEWIALSKGDNHIVG